MVVKPCAVSLAILLTLWYKGGSATGPQLLASVVPRPNAASAMANMGVPPTPGVPHADATHAGYAQQMPPAQGGVTLLLSPLISFATHTFLNVGVDVVPTQLACCMLTRLSTTLWFAAYVVGFLQLSFVMHVRVNQNVSLE